jgi:TonB-like protein
MSDIKDVVLQFPCPLRKESFDKNTKGYYCDKCSSEVIDFSGKSLNELRCEMEKSEKPVCGIFKKSQLSDHFIKYAAAAFFVSSTLTFQSIAQEKTKIDPDPTLRANVDEETEPTLFGMIVEVPAQPVGGFEKFIAALSREIKYPPGLNEKGKCFVEILIDTSGHAYSFKILKSFNKDADQEAVRALTKLNYPWTPAKQRGKSLTSRFIMPIAFDPDKGRKDIKR